MGERFVLVAALLAFLVPCLGAGGRLVDRMQEREAASLLDKADKLYQLRESAQAIQIYHNIVNLYPQTPQACTANLRLGMHYKSERKYAEAITHLNLCATASRQSAEVAAALVAIGSCYHEQQDHGKAFTVLREVTERFSGTDYCNQAFQLIGDGHFALKNYKRAIEAYAMVGTVVPGDDPHLRKLAPGQRLFVRLQDADLRRQARLKQSITVEVVAASGDRESVALSPLGADGNEFLGWVATALGKAVPADGTLQVLGGDEVQVLYTDAHTTGGKANVTRVHRVAMVSDGQVAFTDGAYAHKVNGIALERTANIRVVDYDRSRSAEQNAVKVLLRVLRETPLSEEERAAALASGKPPEPRWQIVDHMELVLAEKPNAEGALHTGVFTGAVPVRDEAPNEQDAALQARSGDIIEVQYVDEQRLSSEKSETLSDRACVVVGTLNPMKAFDSNIGDVHLRVRTELQVATTLLEMGRIYKDLGLEEQAHKKLEEALYEAGKVAREQGGRDRQLLEECQYLLWRIYFERDDPVRAQQVCLNLLKQFPDSKYVDHALMTIGKAAQVKGNYGAAISSYQRLLGVRGSPLRADAQFAIAECYEKMGERAPAHYEQALQEYRRCVEMFPQSKFAAEAIVKIANFYYRTKDFPRAVETYERALRDYRDAGFADLILFNYGRALLDMGERGRALDQFRQLIADHPESKHVAVARAIVEKLRQLPAGGDIRMGDEKAGEGEGRP